MKIYFFPKTSSKCCDVRKFSQKISNVEYKGFCFSTIHLTVPIPMRGFASKLVACRSYGLQDCLGHEDDNKL